MELESAIGPDSRYARDACLMACKGLIRPAKWVSDKLKPEGTLSLRRPRRRVLIQKLTGLKFKLCFNPSPSMRSLHLLPIFKFVIESRIPEFRIE